MSLLVDIGCPNCGRKTTVSKQGLGRYYCEACDLTFTHDDLVSVPDPARMPGEVPSCEDGTPDEE